MSKNTRPVGQKKSLLLRTLELQKRSFVGSRCSSEDPVVNINSNVEKKHDMLSRRKLCFSERQSCKSGLPEWLLINFVHSSNFLFIFAADLG